MEILKKKKSFLMAQRVRIHHQSLAWNFHMLGATAHPLKNKKKRKEKKKVDPENSHHKEKKSVTI